MVIELVIISGSISICTAIVPTINSAMTTTMVMAIDTTLDSIFSTIATESAVKEKSTRMEVKKKRINAFRGISIASNIKEPSTK